MNSKLVILLFSLYMAGSEVHAFGFLTDIITTPLGAMSESLFKWNPFKLDSAHPLKSFVSNFDDFDLAGQTVKHNHDYGCNCRGFVCRCCSHIESTIMEMSSQGCLNTTYRSEDLNIKLTFDLDGRLVFNTLVSITNPPDLCFGEPHGMGNLCLKFYQLDARNRTLSGCVDTAPKLSGKELGRIRLGCFRHANYSAYMERKTVSVQNFKKRTTYVYDGNKSETSDETPTQSKLEQVGKQILFGTYNAVIEMLKNMYWPSQTGSSTNADAGDGSFFSAFFKPIRFLTSLFSLFFPTRTARILSAPLLEAYNGTRLSLENDTMLLDVE